MSSIKNMEMAAALSQNEHIVIKKSLFGQKATYEPTGSPIDGTVLEYAPADGEALERLLRTPLDKLEAELKSKGKPKSTAVGQYRLEVCRSKDGQFIAVQLFRFSNFNYAAASELLTATGSDVAVLEALL